MKDHIIARATERFCLDKDHPSGILVEGFPTGLGKSHEACYMMLDVIQKDPDAKFIFICNQTKNLPIDKLRSIAKKNFKMTDKKVDSIVLSLKSNTDTFTENFKDPMKKHIRALFSEFDIPESVLNKVVHYRNLLKRLNKTNTAPEYLAQLQTEYEDTEREFRTAIHKILKPMGGPKVRLQHIDDEEEYSWIRDLYPAVDFDSYKIILMSDAKFLNTIDPVIAAPFTIWSETDFRMITKKKDEEEEDIDEDYDSEKPQESSRLLNHIIIIDEFDTFKSVIQDVLVKEQEDEVDAIRAFRNLYLRLQQWKNLPHLMVSESSWWKKTKTIHIKDRFEKLIQKSKAIRTKHHMEYLFKQFGVNDAGELTDPPRSSFMFRDYEPYSIGTAFTIRTEPEFRYNRILVGKGITSTTSKFTVMFSSLNELFNGVAKLVRDLAFNYMYSQDEVKTDSKKKDKKKIDDHKSFTNCVDSVIDALDMEPDLARFIKTKVIHNRLKTGTEKRLALDDPTMFSRGFSYISLRDAVNKQLQTHLYYTDYDATPETVLRHMAERTKVIALSATAEFDSPVCNFSQRYLRDGGVYFHEFNEEENTEIHELINSLKDGFIKGKSNLNCEILPNVVTYNSSTWESMFDEDEAEDLYHKLGITREDETFAEIRYVRAAQAFESFLKHDDIQSMIGFFSAHVKNSPDGKFTTDKVNYLLSKLARKYKLCIGVKWDGSPDIVPLNEKAGDPSAFVIQITGTNYDSVKDEVLDRLSGRYEGCNGNGQKVFVITAYQTLGAGQNLQYAKPQNVEKDCKWIRSVMHNYDLADPEKDFDAIYLDDPTGVGPTIDYNNKASLDNYLFFAEYLDATGQITLQDKQQNVKHAFRQCYTPNLNRQPSHFKDCEAYILAKAQVVDQAVGRMTRTGWKRKNVYLFVDRALVNGGTFALPKEYYGNYLSYEFETLYDTVHGLKELEKRDDEAELIIDDCLRISHNFVGYLNDLRYSVYGGDKEAIAKWQEIRNFVIRHPTCPKKMNDLSKTESTVHRYGYMLPPAKTDRYWFTLKYDFDQNGTDGLEISFDGEPAKLERGDLGKIWYSATPETARLSMMTSIDYVKKYLIKEKIPLDFDPNDKVMCPPLFRNIYMGGLGEIVGKLIVEHLTGDQVKLSDMGDKLYERFDFRFGDKIFFDFKDWNETYYYDEKKTEQILNHITDKLVECEGKRVYVINIVVDGEQKYEPFHVYPVTNGKEIVTVPYLYVVSKNKVTPNGEFISKLLGDIEND